MDQDLWNIRIIAVTLRGISSLFSFFLFGFTIYKTYRQQITNLKCLRLSSFSVIDLQMLYCCLSSGIANLFYFTVLDQDRLEQKIQTKEMEPYDYFWGIIQVFLEQGSIFSYSLLSLYSIIIIINSTAAIKKYIKNTTKRRIKKTKVSDKTIKIIFIIIEIFFPLLLALLPFVIDTPYEYGDLSLWPFLTGKYYFSFIFYYLWIMIACVIAIIQFAISVYSLSLLRKSSLQRINSSIMSSEEDSNDNIYNADKDFEQLGSTVDNSAILSVASSQTGSKNREFQKARRREEKVFKIAIMKSFFITISFIIQWIPSAICRIIVMIKKSASPTERYFFACCGQSLWFLTTVLYFLRLGIVFRKKTHKKRKRNTLNV